MGGARDSDRIATKCDVLRRTTCGDVESNSIAQRTGLREKIKWVVN